MHPKEITAELEWYKKTCKGDSLDAQALLFDLSSDLGERNNLHQMYPERVKAMKKRLFDIEKKNSTGK